MGAPSVEFSPAVHPHACGEYRLDHGIGARSIGSPPRLWGILRQDRPCAWCTRFTPTPVGNTGLKPAAILILAVHPHACGEYTSSCRALTTSCGSPPRLWGILGLPRLTPVTRRFTPTPVGNTVSRSRSRGRGAVHPHACGEYNEGVSAVPILLGSPPRLWGILHPDDVRRMPWRFTPTPVGNTEAAAAAVGAASVHPHACGEYWSG